MIYRISQILILTLIITFGSCSGTSDSGLDIYENYTGTLTWGGQPAADGVGLLFETGDKTYGIPGDKSDFSEFFTENSNSVDIRTDFVITGKKTVRGWGATFTEAILIKPQRIP